MKRALLFIPFCLLGLLLLTSATSPEILQNILRKLQQYHRSNPQQKLYLHVDKPFYAAGDNLWFKAYLMEGSLHTLDSLSRVVYVDLIDDNHHVFRQQMFFSPDGVTYGDFQLPDTLQEGRYAIRAYTNYMKNFSEDFFFTKEFSVLNPLRTYPAKPDQKFAGDSLDLTFYPEGGNFVACGFNRLAFKALSPDGKGINVEGTIVDDNNTIITSFQSQHLGMGMIKINPVEGKKYFAIIKKPYAVNRAYPLPDVRAKGYTMQVEAVNNNLKVIVFTNADKSASGNQLINLVVQSRGQAYHAQQGTMTNNGFFTLIPRSKFPDGISQITIFDSEGRPVAERLVHQNHQETIKLKIETDTSVYGKRKMVTVMTDALYNNGSPALGHFSISVYDEGVIKNPEAYPLSIVNYLSLTSDLRGYIEDPGYYFKDSLVETKRNLDLLMMVNGWRRFTWNDVLTEKPASLFYQHERGVPISGKVLKAGGKNPPADSKLKILTMDGKAVRLKPDSLGRFYTDSLLYYDSMMLVFQTENQKGKKQPYKFSLDPVSLPPPFTQSLTSYMGFDASPFLQQRADEKLIENSSKAKVLDEVKVTAKREQPDPRLKDPRSSNTRVIDVNKNGGGMGYQNIFQMIQNKIPGVIVSGNSIQIRGKNAGFVVNGTMTGAGDISSIAPTDVDFVEVIYNSVQHEGLHVINIILKNGSTIGNYEPVGVNRAKIAGFYQAREFYSPNYGESDLRHQLADKRTTLFWEPMIITNEFGRAGVAFYTADIASRYRIVMEGITADGYPGTATVVFEVK